MIDFSTLQGLSIPEGVVTQITDASGRVLWMLPMDGDTVVLEVAKKTGNTYAGETTYENEEFILLDIYPKKGGTVNITYEGLTKSIVDDGTAEEPNAQQVYFGTFNGVSDSVATPTSGTLTIEGDYRAFAGGTYNTAKATSSAYYRINSIKSFGISECVVESAFGSILNGSCGSINSVRFPSSVLSIGASAFYNCYGLKSATFSEGLLSIDAMAFFSCKLSSIKIPSSVTNITGNSFAVNPLERITVDENNKYFSSDGVALFNKDKTTIVSCTNASGHYSIPKSVKNIGDYAFYGCSNLTEITIPEGVTSIGESSFTSCDSLLNVVIPSSVLSIGASAFYIATDKQKTITMLSSEPPIIASGTFKNSGASGSNPYHNIIVPKGCGNAYKSAEVWSELADYIVEAS